jgi:hypothetical protein
MVKLATPAAVLLGALPFLDLFVVVKAETAYSRVTILDGIPYYIRDITIGRIPKVAIPALNMRPDMDVLALTIISSNSSSFTASKFDGIIADYLARDDVFSSAFLSGAYTLP